MRDQQLDQVVGSIVTEKYDILSVLQSVSYWFLFICSKSDSKNNLTTNEKVHLNQLVVMSK